MSSGVPEEAVRAFAARWGFDADSPRLRAALTHASAADGVAGSNERLEFLGDALLSAFVARYLIETLPPEADEDVLSRARIQVVRKETLARAARALGLADLLNVGPNERKEQRQTRDSALADAFEAVIAALFLDRGDDAMGAFLRATLAEPLAEVVAAPPAPDAKTTLQMRLQSSGRGLPVYRTVSETGVGDAHHFVVEVADGAGTVLGYGEGANKRGAQMEAARRALEADLPAVAAAESEVPHFALRDADLPAAGDGSVR